MSTSQTLAIVESIHAGLLALPPPVDPDVRQMDRRLRRILVATDGTSASDGALSVASLLAERHGAKLDVVSVLVRWGPPGPIHEVLDMTGELLAERLNRVLPRVIRAFAPGIPWTLRVMDGGLVPSIIDAAHELDSDLIVSGMRRGWIDRYLRRPTSLKLVESAEVPVLAVPASAKSLPSRAVIGVAGTETDLVLAPAATVLLDVAPEIHLVHVRTGDELPMDAGDAAGSPFVGWAPRFERLEREITSSSLASVERSILRGGHPASRLVRYAARRGASLVAVRTEKTRSLRQRMFGGVARRLLRDAECCVLLLGPKLVPINAGAPGRRHTRPGAGHSPEHAGRARGSEDGGVTRFEA